MVCSYSKGRVEAADMGQKLEELWKFSTVTATDDELFFLEEDGTPALDQEFRVAFTILGHICPTTPPLNSHKMVCLGVFVFVFKEIF